MIKIINPIPQEIITASQTLLVDTKLRQEGHSSQIGSGSHSVVYRLFDKYAVKFFNNKAIRGNYFDYIYLEQLQGIPYVPILYGYSEKSFIIEEYVDGLNLFDYFALHKKLPPNFKTILSDALNCIFERNIVPVDFKLTEHVIWNDKTSTLKLIDFGVCDSCAHMSQEFNKMMNQEWIDCTIKDIDNFLAYMSPPKNNF